MVLASDKLIQTIGGDIEFLKVYPETNTFIYYHPHLLSEDDASKHMEKMILGNEIKFKDEPRPNNSGHSRKTAYMGSHPYIYSNKLCLPAPIPLDVRNIIKMTEDKLMILLPKIQSLMKQQQMTSSTPEVKVTDLYNDPNMEDKDTTETKKTKYHNVLAVLYETDQNSVAFHRDAEDTIDQSVPIASISFGSPRTFAIKPYLKSKIQKKLKTMGILPPQLNITLNNGSLLIMGGDCQSHWSHSLLKERKLKKINDTNINNPIDLADLTNIADGTKIIPLWDARITSADHKTQNINNIITDNYIDNDGNPQKEINTYTFNIDNFNIHNNPRMNYTLRASKPHPPLLILDGNCQDHFTHLL